MSRSGLSPEILEDQIASRLYLKQMEIVAQIVADRYELL